MRAVKWVLVKPVTILLRVTYQSQHFRILISLKLLFCWESLLLTLMM